MKNIAQTNFGTPKFGYPCRHSEYAW